jgi:hypothetical protein
MQSQVTSREVALSTERTATATLATDDDTQNTQEAQSSGEANIVIRETTFTQSEVQRHSVAGVRMAVENTGSAAGERDIFVRMAGKGDSQTILLTSGESETITDGFHRHWCLHHQQRHREIHRVITFTCTVHFPTGSGGIPELPCRPILCIA